MQDFTCALVDSMVSKSYGVDVPGTLINVRVQPGGPSAFASVFGPILVGSGGQLLRL